MQSPLAHPFFPSFSCQLPYLWISLQREVQQPRWGKLLMRTKVQMQGKRSQASVPGVYERDKYHPNTHIFPIQICGSVFLTSFKAKFSSLPFLPSSAHTHKCTHTQTLALKSLVLSQNLKIIQLLTLTCQHLRQEAEILTPWGLWLNKPRSITHQTMSKWTCCVCYFPFLLKT